MNNKFIVFGADNCVDFDASVEAFTTWLKAEAEALQAERAATAAQGAAFDVALSKVFDAYEAAGRNKVPLDELVNEAANLLGADLHSRLAIRAPLTAWVETHYPAAKGRNGGRQRRA